MTARPVVSVDARLAEIEQREQAATPGEWGVGDGWVYTSPIYPDDHRLANVFGMRFLDPERMEAERQRGYANADFIAHARADVPWLLSQLRDARAENERLREQIVAEPAASASVRGDNMEIVGVRVTSRGLYGDAYEAERNDLRTRLIAAEAKLAAVRELVADLAEYGTRADLMPTVMFGDESHVYRQLTRYLERVDTSLRERAVAALAAAEQDEPKRCVCDGASYYSDAENAARPPFIVSGNCPVHVSQPTEGSEQ